MTDNGYPASFAYAKAVRSIRSIIDDIDEVGVEEYLTRRASRTCEFAVRTSGPRVINEDAIQQIFEETEKGIFARNWLNEFNLGMLKLAGVRTPRLAVDADKSGASVPEVARQARLSEAHEPPTDSFFPLSDAQTQHPPRPQRKRRPVVGLAWDEAFSFCYADLPAVLHELGARIVAFSPLRDAAPPAECSGLYFPGGYPELHALP